MVHSEERSMERHEDFSHHEDEDWGSHHEDEDWGSHHEDEDWGSHHGDERSGLAEGSNEDSDIGSGSHENSFWRGCSEKYWGDDKHEHDAKKFALLGVVLFLVIAIAITVTVVIICKKKRAKACRQAAANARKAQIQQAVVVNDDKPHPKAIEAYGPTGLPAPVVISMADAPPKEGSGVEDPRVMIGIWSPPPAYDQAPVAE